MAALLVLPASPALLISIMFVMMGRAAR